MRSKVGVRCHKEDRARPKLKKKKKTGALSACQAKAGDLPSETHSH